MNSPKSNATEASLYIKWLRDARQKQIAPSGDWNIWLILAGRGWGKTRTGAQDIIAYALRYPKVRCAVVAPTFGDLRRVCYDGESGINSLLTDDCYWQQSKSKGYNRSNVEIVLFNESIIQGYAASEPDRMRGPQYHRAWCDELAAWRYTDAWDQLQFGMRLGEKPRTIITTTPRPTPLIRSLHDRKDVRVTQGDTFENSANLAASALASFKERYEGTRLGRQELYAEILDDIEGALWTYKMIEDTRVREAPEMTRVVVGVDPAVTSTKASNETGIVVCGLGVDGKFYVIDDVSGIMTPDAWGKTAINAYYKHKASRIIAEVNNGGDLVERLLRTIDKNIPYTSVSATRGKLVRAEPISALYEQQRVSHLGIFKQLEDQMCSYVGEKSGSPDRLDALVWAMTELSRSSLSAMWRVT